MTNFSDLKSMNDLVAKDIIELQNRIEKFKTGKIDEERFKLYRLTRGVYGQRQTGVHMFRTKIPFGKLTTQQLIRLAEVSEKYTNGNLHLTTRQNIQMHYVKLDDSPAIWTELSAVGVTAREACGNTVRNLTASAIAGVDPDELFDVSPYVQAVYEYFLRNPICQEMGRKIKPAFSSSDRDSAYTYFHDFGFIPRIKNENGNEIRGFKLVVGGGLGAQSIIAQTAFEFIHEDQIIPFMEAAIRVFDRHGEREKRFKARMKYLIKKLGLEEWMALVEQERLAIKNKEVKIDRTTIESQLPAQSEWPIIDVADQSKYEAWLMTNVFEQKQKNFFSAQIRIPLGDIHADQAKKLAAIIKKYAADDLRLTVNQGISLRYISRSALPHLFNELSALGYAKPGFDTIADITACPGTDTCNLAVTNSTGLATKIEEVIAEEYAHLIGSSDIKIKMSGCMNACGQHMAAQIGFHGSSIKKKALVIPAMQIVLGGGVADDGQGFIAEKVIKLPTKRIPDSVRILLDDYENNAEEGEYFNDYFQRNGKKYFYNILKPLADIETLAAEDFFDWGQDSNYIQAIGVGECAGVIFDVVGTIIKDGEEKLSLAKEAFEKEDWSDSIYHSYSSFIVAAKALLLSNDVKCNTHKGIISDFEKHYVETGLFGFETTFAEVVLQLNKEEATKGFANAYFNQATTFFKHVITEREKQLGGNDKEVIKSYYTA